MSLWRYPRTAAALCIAAVLACAAAPAAFLAASDAAYFGRVETVADPYRAPTPTADDYYILRQLAARGQDTTARQTTPQQEQDAAPQTPKVYIGASASIESMTWADTAATTAAAFLDKLFDPVFRHDLAGFLQLFQSLTGSFGDDFGMGIRGIVVL